MSKCLCGTCFKPKRIHPDAESRDRLSVYVIDNGKINTDVNKNTCFPGCCELKWKKRFREMILQTRRVTSSAGDNLMYPTKHGLPSSTQTVDIRVSGGQGHDGRGWIRGWWMVPDDYKGFTVLYLHGISNSRAYYHRLGMYKLLLDLGYRVLAIDYRGFADSTPVDVTESTLLEDSLFALAWLKKNKITDRDRLILWGHSMGAAVACRTIHYLENDEDRSQREIVDTLVLESPFNNLHDEILHAVCDRGIVGKVCARMAPVHSILKSSDMQFCSDYWIKDLETYIFILHAEDDQTIPPHLAKYLFRSCYDRGKYNVHMTTFSSELRLGHNHIYKCSDLKSLIQKHVERELVQ